MTQPGLATSPNGVDVVSLTKTFSPNAGSSRPSVTDHQIRTLSTRGSFIPYVIGRRRVAPVVGWVGGRGVTKESRPGQPKKGSHSKKTGGSLIYLESGWHMVCVGPAERLHAIYKSGKVIWSGPLDRDTSPSGTEVNLGTEGIFRIYWGEVDQPIDALLTSAAGVGIASRWPYVCYVYWTPARLGPHPAWGDYQYDIETEVLNPVLTKTLPDMGLSPCTPAGVKGVNPAHALGQILFDDYPQGLSLDQAEFDLDSLEVMAQATGAVHADSVIPSPVGPSLGAHWDAATPSSFTKVGDDIDEWADLSGNGRDLVTPGNMPEEVDSGRCQAVGFVKADSEYMEVPSWAGIESHGFCIFVVFRVTPDAWVSSFSANEGNIWRLNNSGDFKRYIQFRMNYLYSGDGSRITGAGGILEFRNGGTTFNLGLTFIDDLDAPRDIGFVLNLRNSGDHRVWSTTGQVWVDITASSNGTFPSGVDTFHVGGTPMSGGKFGDLQVHEAFIIDSLEDDTSLEPFTDYLLSRWLSCEGECIITNLIGQDGQQANSIISKVMEDVGLLLPWNANLGKFQFQAIRKVSDPQFIPSFVEANISSKPQQIETPLIELAADQVIFSFSDWEHAFVESTIAVDDDGHADLTSFQKAKRVGISTVIDFKTAGIIAERRSQEILGQPTRYTFYMGRDGRYLRPGRVFLVSGIAQILRAMSVKFDLRTGVTIVVALTDVYGSNLSSFAPASTGNQASFAEPDEDLQVGVVEVPAYLLGGSQNPAVLVPRVRADDSVSGALIHFSGDGTSYVEKDHQDETQTGGALTSALAADTSWYLPQGPTFDAAGPDITAATDLTGAEALWRSGRQIVVINDEIFFCKKITALGGISYRLDELLRARYDTQRQAHSSSDKVYIFLDDQIRPHQDLGLLLPGKTLYVKSQPIASVARDLSTVTAVTKSLYGKGLTPMPPSALRCNEGRNSYYTGEDIPLKWAYASALIPGTGAGLQPAGDPTGDAPVDGNFRLKFLTTGDVLKRTVEGLSVLTYTYDNGDLVSDFGGEQDIKVQLTNYKAGYESSAVEITVELL